MDARLGNRGVNSKRLSLRRFVRPILLVTVEHIHINAGGQAMVSVVGGPGGGDRAKSEEQPHAKQMQCT